MMLWINEDCKKERKKKKAAQKNVDKKKQENRMNHGKEGLKKYKNVTRKNN